MLKPSMKNFNLQKVEFKKSTLKRDETKTRQRQRQHKDDKGEGGDAAQSPPILRPAPSDPTAIGSTLPP